MIDGLSTPALALLFAAAAAAIWLASRTLTVSTETLAAHWRLGETVAGLALVAIVEDLPEVVIVVSAALAGHHDLIVGVLLGGVATQTVLLALIDLFVPDQPLSRGAASAPLVLAGLQGVIVFSMVILATQLPPAGPPSAGPAAIAAAWLLTMWLIRRAGNGLSWKEGPHAPLTGRAAAARKALEAYEARTSSRRALSLFVASAALILAAGTVLERTGSALAGRMGWSGIVFGATVLALAAALPEISVGIAAARTGEYELAVSQIFGSNNFLPALFLPAALLSGEQVLAGAGPAEIYLTGLGLLMTGIALWGLLFRPGRQYLRLGPDSIAVVLAYVAGMAGLALLAG